MRARLRVCTALSVDVKIRDMDVDVDKDIYVTRAVAPSGLDGCASASASRPRR